MNHPTSEEVWGPGDWWQRRISKKKVTKPVVHKVQVVEPPPEKIYKVQIVRGDEEWWCTALGAYIFGVLVIKIIWGSWFSALLWPIVACIWVGMKLIF